MKKLITLIFSAVLLCPMWAGAQTKTTPSMVGPLKYSGEIILIRDDSWKLSLRVDVNCRRINAFVINILLPNNESPVKHANGHFECLALTPYSPLATNTAWTPFAGTITATNGLNPASAGGPITGYIGNFNVSAGHATCDFSADLINATCELYTLHNADFSGKRGETGKFVYIK
jgi:hypothetical protein